MNAVEDLSDPQVPIAQACTALGLSRATLYRHTEPAQPASVAVRAPSPRRLSDAERQTVLDVMHSEEFVDQPPPEVYARLLSRGVYLASIRTLYRVLAAFGESGERRAQRGPMKHAKPTGFPGELGGHDDGSRAASSPRRVSCRGAGSQRPGDAFTQSLAC